MSEFDYDLFVIGAGSGGVRAARIAANHGARVAIAEEYRYGGTCVIRGCVPKKLLVYASHFAETFEDAAGFGWSVGARSFDWNRLIAAKDAEISRLEGIYRANLEKAGVALFDSRAEVDGPNSVVLKADGRRITAAKILIATGGTPNHLGIPGEDQSITSNEIFHLEDFPARTVIYGGGFIAVEFAGILNGLGSDVTLVYRGEEILRGFDDDLRKALHIELAKKGVRFVTEDTIAGIEGTRGELTVVTAKGERIAADQVLMAVGRDPNTSGLGLETAGVELDAAGAVKVDERSRTNVHSIFAVGDVTNRVNLTPVAIREGHAFADTEFGGKAVSVDHSLVPAAVFSQPEIGTVGLTEAEARKRHSSLDIYRASFRPMVHTLSGRDEKMLMKLIVDADTDRVLGVHILGPDAGEMAQLLGIALKMGATKADFDATMAVHPTAAEELVTMREPSERVRREAAE